jgi:hypothetical protein
LNQAMEALEAELAIKHLAQEQTFVNQEREAFKTPVKPKTSKQGPRRDFSPRLDEIAKMRVDEFGSGFLDM